MTTAISVRGLHKRYGDTAVLNGIDLDVESGTVFALLGPNGAGKTTTVHVLSTLVPADAGVITVGGSDLDTDAAGVRRSIGLTGQFAAVDDYLNGEENLRLMARLHHLGRREEDARVASLLERFELTDVARKPLMTYSGGMKRKLDLAMTLVGRPRIIFLDEPTTGLDPRSRQTMWDIVRDLLRDGTTVFLTTQYLEEADRLADQVAVLNDGVIVAQDTSAALKSRVGTDVLIVTLDGVRREIPVDGSAHALQTALASVAPEASVELRSPTLDDVFFALTGTPRQEES